LPEGMFGFGSYGGAGALPGLGIGGGSLGGGFGNFFGPGQFAALQQQPRLTNVSLADITQALSPRSKVTIAGSYGLVHFIDNNFDDAVSALLTMTTTLPEHVALPAPRTMSVE